MDMMTRRRAMMGATASSPTPSNALLEKGTLAFNAYTISISDGRWIRAEKDTGTGTDAYNVWRMYNLSDFSSNVTTGTKKTADVYNQPKKKTIPAGASCVLSITGGGGQYSASYTYYLIQLISTANAVIKQIGRGKNLPSGTSDSVSWTQAADVDIGCLALYATHTYVGNYVSGTLSFTVNGEEMKNSAGRLTPW